MGEDPEDVVTGASVEVTVEVAGSPQEVWELITDVTRIGRWIPECVDGWWIDTDPPLPRVGARFEGHNRFPSGFEATVPCVVTEVEPSRAFGWVALDPDELVERPGSIWSYRLTPSSSAERTIVTQRFEHGPGMTGLRRGTIEEPEHAREIIDGRLAQLERNMTRTIEAMGRDVSA
jgi:uncharacterized protein YndB with AHSA1/START domain